MAIDAVVGILSDPTNGYNAIFPQVLTSGGYPELPVLPNELDFNDNSRSFAKSYLAGLADMDLSEISDSLSVVIYTTQVQNLGLVIAAVEDTAMTVLHADDANTALWLPGVVYGLVWQSSTTPLFQVSDGYQQVLQIQFPLEVRIL
jgi:hypothetical protein